MALAGNKATGTTLHIDISSGDPSAEGRPLGLIGFEGFKKAILHFNFEDGVLYLREESSRIP